MKGLENEHMDSNQSHGVDALSKDIRCSPRHLSDFVFLRVRAFSRLITLIRDDAIAVRPDPSIKRLKK
jgi:hypothetical protein